MEDVSMMDWQATPPAAEINAVYNPAMLERRRLRDEFEIPNMPGGWIDYYTERQFNVEDVVQFQHLAKPSIITCAKQAAGQAKRRCVQVAVSAIQKPLQLFNMAQNTAGQTVNQIVRRVRRAQAARRRRRRSPRRSPRTSPRQSPRVMLPIDISLTAMATLPPITPIDPSQAGTAKPPFLVPIGPPHAITLKPSSPTPMDICRTPMGICRVPTPSPSSHGIVAFCERAAAGSSPATPSRVISSRGHLPGTHATDPMDITWNTPSPSKWLNLSHDVSYIDLNPTPPETPISQGTAAEGESDEVMSDANESPSTSGTDNESPVTPPAKPYPSYMEGTDVDFSSHVQHYSPEPSSIKASITTTKPLPPVTPKRQLYPSYLEGNDSDFSSSLDFSPNVTGVASYVDDTFADIGDSSSIHHNTATENVNYSDENIVTTAEDVVDTSETLHHTTQNFDDATEDVVNTTENLAITAEEVVDTPENLHHTTHNIRDTIENLHHTIQTIHDTTENVIDATEDIECFSSYIMDFSTELADYPAHQEFTWFNQPAVANFKKSPDIPSRRVTRNTVRQEEEERHRKEERRQRNLDKAKISALTEEWENKVCEAVRTGFAPDYQASDFARVVPPPGSRFTDSWLNDETVNGYLKLITTYHNTHHTSLVPKSHAFTSFMFKQIAEKGYQGVARWAKRAKMGGGNLLKTHTIFIPVNNGSHWTLMVVYPGARTAHYYDSMGQNRYDSGRRSFDLLKIWLRGELGSQFKEREWSFSDKESPQQDNSSDCGVFAVTTAKMLILGAPVLGYGAADIPLQRKRIVAELVNGNFL